MFLQSWFVTPDDKLQPLALCIRKDALLIQTAFTRAALRWLCCKSDNVSRFMKHRQFVRVINESVRCKLTCQKAVNCFKSLPCGWGCVPSCHVAHRCMCDVKGRPAVVLQPASLLTYKTWEGLGGLSFKDFKTLLLFWCVGVPIQLVQKHFGPVCSPARKTALWLLSVNGQPVRQLVCQVCSSLNGFFYELSS